MDNLLLVTVRQCTSKACDILNQERFNVTIETNKDREITRKPAYLLHVK
jgi:hypothetical protein